MPLSKKAKIWIIVACAPLILLLGTAAALKLTFTSDRLKALILPRIEEATHRSVSVRDISFTFFPTLGVAVEGLTVSNPRRGTFGRPQFLTLEEMRVAVAFLPLLGGNIEVKRVLLDRPDVALEVDADGIKNYGSEAARAQAEEAAGPGAAFGKQILLLNFEVKDGRIELIDRKFDSRLVIEGLHETARAATLAGGGELHVETEATVERLSYGTVKSMFISELPLRARASATLHAQPMAMTIDSAAIRLKDLPLTMTGSVSDLSGVPKMDLLVTSPGVQMSQILSLLSPDMLQAAQGMTSSGDVTFRLAVQGRSSETINPGIRCTFSVASGTIRYSALPKAITNVMLSGNFEKPEAPVGATGIGSFVLDKFSASLGDNTMGGTLRMENFDDPLIAMTFEGSMDLGNVKEFYPLKEGTRLAGAMKARVSIDGRAKNPAGLKAGGSVELRNVTVESAASSRPLRNLNGTIVFNNQAVQSQRLGMEIGQSDLSCSFALRNYLGLVMERAAGAQPPSATVTLTSRQLRTADLLPEEPASPQGTPRAAPAKGEAGGVPPLDIEANVGIATLVTEKFEFTNARGAVAISGGIVTLKNFTVNAFNGVVRTKGTLDLRQKDKRPFNLDLDITGADAHAALPPFTSFGNNLFGTFTTSTKLRGDLNDTLGFNPQTLAGSGRVQIADGTLQRLPLSSGLAAATGLDELRVINFRDWSNVFSIAGGRVNVNDLRINAGSTAFVANGSQGLDGSLDYTLGVKLPPSVSGRLKLPGVADQLLQFFKDSEGRINLNFHVGGMTSSPDLKLDTRAQEDLAKKALEQKVDEGKKKVEEGLKKKGEDVLKKLLKRP